MNLNELASEYRIATDEVTDRLQRLRAEAPQVRGAAALLHQRRMDALGDELRDLRIITAHLERYYHRPTRKELFPC